MVILLPHPLLPRQLQKVTVCLRLKSFVCEVTGQTWDPRLGQRWILKEEEEEEKEEEGEGERGGIS